MISSEFYEAWVCLSKLVPMIWQTDISNIDVYVVRITPVICYVSQYLNRIFSVISSARLMPS